ncbi:hypothetical protein CWATWH0402_5832 [Crocosphaera watsonii WH 0402]|uniref:Mobilization protein MobD-like protein n=2 Tax=Crocosphaera watsonii TaxID=263511 RepID=T2JS13_CROWT|nr:MULTISPECIES: hypothetical protein [Crocosphaera]NQZ63747.1 hypothetical protein [Crocosphaera sp.]CCQ67829.1 hypothetical protein CWATWH0402_5832 [Crocosphaera watsonii WH 0402]
MKKIYLVDKKTGSIHLIDSEKGGMGKSMTARVAIEYIQDIIKIDSSLVEIIDADKAQPLVGRTYAPHHYLQEENGDISMKEASSLNDLAKQIAMIYFTDNEKIASQTDVIVELAETKAVIVNLPAAVFDLVNSWLNEGGILELVSTLNIPIYKWFVTDGCQESIDTLKKSYLLYGNKIHHIIVKNRGLATTEMDWWAFERDEELALYMEEYKETTYTIDLPFLTAANASYEALKKGNLTIRDVANIKKAKELGFLMAQSARFKKWRELTFEQFNTLPWKKTEDSLLSQAQDNVGNSSDVAQSNSTK